jgi:hypothetical protein
MSVFDSNAFVITGQTDSGSTVTAADTVLLLAPCDLDVSGVQLYATTGPTGASGLSYNIKVTPPTSAEVYQRSYNYTAVSKSVASVGTTDGYTWTVTTNSAHGLTASSVFKLDGVTASKLNVKDFAVASIASSTSFTFKTAANYTTSAIATPSSSNISISGSVATYITDAAHGLKTGDKVAITGLTTTAATGFNISTSSPLAVTVNSSTSFSVTLPSTTNTTNTTITGAALILPTYVSTVTFPANVTAGTVANAVQDQLVPTDYNVAPDFTPNTNAAFFLYAQDKVVAPVSSGAAVSSLGGADNYYNVDGRVSKKILKGSLVALTIVKPGATAASGLRYSVEFTKE